MSGLWESMGSFFLGEQPVKKKPKMGEAVKRASSGPNSPRSKGRPAATSANGDSKLPKVQVLRRGAGRPATPYWKLRRWRRVSPSLYLGYYKTPFGRYHGVIKWVSKFNYGIYVHDVPQVILEGPHGSCFIEVRPGKFRVHFDRHPKDLNSVIFFMEILLMEAFNHEQGV